jgi:hypothetical protein
MKQVEVRYSDSVLIKNAVELVSSVLDKQPKNSLANEPWPMAGPNPEVFFSMLYGDDCIALKYYITENEHKAQYNQTNDPVYKDSCAELFISLNNEKEYYNIECNSMGTILAAFGPDRENRTYLSPSTINMIRRRGVIISETNSESIIKWELTLLIPFTFFCYHQLSSLKNKTAMANLYKCGDDLAHPHYLCWNYIENKNPDFHLPQFFGMIHFV